MQTLLRASLVGAALALAAAPGEATDSPARVVVHREVRGRLEATDDGGDAHGLFSMTIDTKGDVRREVLLVRGWRLDVTRDDDGNLPDYHAVLVASDGETEADFGEAFLSAAGRLRLRFVSPRDSFPDDASSLRDSSGGTVEIRLGDTVILSGEVPAFLDPGDENSGGSGTLVEAAAWDRLHRTSGHPLAWGRIAVTYVNRPAVQSETLWIECLGLARRGDTFTVVAVDGDDNETTLGTFVVRLRVGAGLLRLATRAGDEISGGGVVALGGQTVEVRDADGNAWLTGTFPDLAAE